MEQVTPFICYKVSDKGKLLEVKIPKKTLLYYLKKHDPSIELNKVENQNQSLRDIYLGRTDLPPKLAYFRLQKYQYLKDIMIVLQKNIKKFIKEIQNQSNNFFRNLNGQELNDFIGGDVSQISLPDFIEKIEPLEDYLYKKFNYLSQELQESITVIKNLCKYFNPREKEENQRKNFKTRGYFVEEEIKHNLSPNSEKMIIWLALLMKVYSRYPLVISDKDPESLKNGERQFLAMPTF